MRNSTLKYLLLVSLLLNVAFLGTVGYRFFQQRSYWTSPFGPRLPRERFLFEELALAPQQIEAMKQRTIPFRVELDRRRAEIAGKRKELLAFMRRDEPNQPAIRALIAEISAMQEKMQHRVAAHILEVKAMLNKEEQESFLDLIENVMSKGSQSGCPSVE